MRGCLIPAGLGASCWGISPTLGLRLPCVSVHSFYERALSFPIVCERWFPPAGSSKSAGDRPWGRGWSSQAWHFLLAGGEGLSSQQSRKACRPASTSPCSLRWEDRGHSCDWWPWGGTPLGSRKVSQGRIGASPVVMPRNVYGFGAASLFSEP